MAMTSRFASAAWMLKDTEHDASATGHDGYWSDTDEELFFAPFTHHAAPPQVPEKETLAAATIPSVPAEAFLRRSLTARALSDEPTMSINGRSGELNVKAVDVAERETENIKRKGKKQPSAGVGAGHDAASRKKPVARRPRHGRHSKVTKVAIALDELDNYDADKVLRVDGLRFLGDKGEEKFVSYLEERFGPVRKFVPVMQETSSGWQKSAGFGFAVMYSVSAVSQVLAAVHVCGVEDLRLRRFAPSAERH